MTTKYALPLTFIFVYDDETGNWAALAGEVDVSSYGANLDDARYMIQDAVSLKVSHELEAGDIARLARPVSPEDLVEFIGDSPPEKRFVEYHTLLVTVDTEPQPKVTSLEFVRSFLTPVCYPPRVAA